MHKGIVLKTNGDKKLIDLELDNILKQSYRELDVQTIDIVTVKIDDIFVNIIVDDEGLLKDDPHVTVSSNLRNLYGNVLILPNDIDEEGRYFRGLNEHEIDTINNNIQTLIDTDQKLLRDVLVFVE